MSGVYKSVSANGAISFSDDPTPGASRVAIIPPPPSADSTKPNRTGARVYTKVMVNGHEEVWEYSRAEAYRDGLKEQLVQAKERAAREIVEARNQAANFKRANEAMDRFFAASERLTNAQSALWDKVQTANKELGFQDRLQDGFSAALSAIGVYLAIVGTGGAAAIVLTAADWGNSAARQYDADPNDALDNASKLNDVVGLLPGEARVAFEAAGAVAGVFTDGKEIADSKPMGISRDVYSPEGRASIRNSIDWNKDANGDLHRGPYQKRWGIDQEGIKGALDDTEAAQKEFDEARAAYELSERRRFDRTSWSEPKR